MATVPDLVVAIRPNVTALTEAFRQLIESSGRFQVVALGLYRASSRPLSKREDADRRRVERAMRLRARRAARRSRRAAARAPLERSP